MRHLLLVAAVCYVASAHITVSRSGPYSVDALTLTSASVRSAATASGWRSGPARAERSSVRSSSAARGSDDRTLGAIPAHSYGVRAVNGAGASDPAVCGFTVRRGERTGCRRRLCRDSYARV